jgi:hypothetical protein
MPHTPTNTDKKAPSGKKRLLVPPEEKFWKHYSPHNEFPLSNAMSIALHVLAGLLLVVVWLVLRQDNSNKRDDVAVIDPVQLDLGPNTDGDPRGGGGGGKDGGTKDAPKENIGTQDPKQNTNPSASSGNVTLEDPKEGPLLEVAKVKDGASDIPIVPVPQNLSETAKKAHLVLAQATAGTGRGTKGRDGGRDGGKDKGRDKGTGPGVGPGSGELAKKRAQRQLRWRLVFNQTSDGRDYRDKLKRLEAILVAGEFKKGTDGRPEVDARGQARLLYRLIEDFRKNPNPPIRDIRDIHRIFWIDDKSVSVDALAEAVGLRPPPRLFACFFPEKIETDLRKLEHAKYPGDERNIIETHFHVEMRGAGYRLVCDKVIHK